MHGIRLWIMECHHACCCTGYVWRVTCCNWRGGVGAVQMADMYGDTPLHWAAYKGHEDVTNLLVPLLPAHTAHTAHTALGPPLPSLPALALSCPAHSLASPGKLAVATPLAHPFSSCQQLQPPLSHPLRLPLRSSGAGQLPTRWRAHGLPCGHSRQLRPGDSSRPPRQHTPHTSLHHTAQHSTAHTTPHCIHHTPQQTPHTAHSTHSTPEASVICAWSARDTRYVHDTRDTQYKHDTRYADTDTRYADTRYAHEHH